MALQKRCSHFFFLQLLPVLTLFKYKKQLGPIVGEDQEKDDAGLHSLFFSLPFFSLLPQAKLKDADQG